MNERCEAKKRDGSLCQKYPIQGRTRCRLHGGATPTGILSHAYQTGKYCKSLPVHLRARYANGETGAALLSHEDDLRLLDVRLGLLAERLTGRDDDDDWGKILDAAEVRAKLVQGEVRRLQVTDQLLSRDESLLLLARMADIMKRAIHANCDDATAKRVLASVVEEFRHLQSFVHQGPQGAIANN